MTNKPTLYLMSEYSRALAEGRFSHGCAHLPDEKRYKNIPVCNIETLRKMNDEEISNLADIIYQMCNSVQPADTHNYNELMMPDLLGTSYSWDEQLQEKKSSRLEEFCKRCIKNNWRTCKERCNYK